MAQSRRNVCPICKTAEKEIVVRLQKKKKILFFESSSEGNKTKGLNPLPKGLILKVPHMDLLAKLDNEDRYSTPSGQ